MAKKNSLRLVFDSPVVILFVAVSTAVFICDFLFNLDISSKVFECHGAESAEPFNFSSVMDYFRFFTYTFGFSGRDSFFVNLIAVLLLGSVLEERYGSLMLALMIFITSLVGGVLTACLSPFNLTGSEGVVFMMTVLSALSFFVKKQLPVSWIFVLVLYIFFALSDNRSVSGFMDFLRNSIPVFIQLASGICGSLFGFFVAPKKREPRRKTEKKPEPEVYSDSGDETVIGNISL